MVWDGETCTYDGPAEVRAGDTLNMDFQNLSDAFATLHVLRLAGDATLEDAREALGDTWVLGESIQPPFVLKAYAFSATTSGNLFGDSTVMVAGQTGVEAVPIALPRRHIFVCLSTDVPGVTPGPGTVVVADSDLSVTE